MSKTSDWNARDYAAHSAAQQEWARELIDTLRLRGDEAVLDIGCGDGRATALIAERLPDGSVLGVDNSARAHALMDALVVAFAPAQVEYHALQRGGMRRVAEPAR